MSNLKVQVDASSTSSCTSSSSIIMIAADSESDTARHLPGLSETRTESWTPLAGCHWQCLLVVAAVTVMVTAGPHRPGMRASSTRSPSHCARVDTQAASGSVDNDSESAPGSPRLSIQVH